MKDAIRRVHDYLDDEIDDHQSRQLESWLGESPDNVRTFVRISHTHRQLRDLTIGQGSRPALATTDQTDCGIPARETSARKMSSGTTRRYATRRFIQLAVVLLVGVTVWLAFFNNVPMHTELRPRTLGRLSGTLDCQWADGQALTADGLLRQGDTLHVKRGLIEVTFDGGARAIVKGPAKLEIVDGARVRLKQGTIWTVCPKSSGFTVESPGTRIVDLGTEFGVDVKDDSLTEAYVLRGRVETQLIDPSGVVIRRAELGNGQATLLNSTERIIRPVKPAPYLFARELDRAQLQTPILHEEFGGRAVFRANQTSEKVSGVDGMPGSVAFDVRITTAGTYQVWLFGSGPRSLSDSIGIQLNRIDNYRAQREQEQPEQQAIHVGASHDGQARWTRVRWGGSGTAELVEGEYRLRITTQDLQAVVEHLVVQLRSLPSPTDQDIKP